MQQYEKVAFIVKNKGRTNRSRRSDGVDSVQFFVKQLLRCPVAQDFSRQRIGPIGHVSNVFYRVPCHTDTLGNESAQQSVVAFIVPFSQDEYGWVK